MEDLRKYDSVEAHDCFTQKQHMATVVICLQGKARPLCDNKTCLNIKHHKQDTYNKTFHKQDAYKYDSVEAQDSFTQKQHMASVVIRLQGKARPLSVTTRQV